MPRGYGFLRAGSKKGTKFTNVFRLIYSSSSENCLNRLIKNYSNYEDVGNIISNVIMFITNNMSMNNQSKEGDVDNEQEINFVC